MKSWQQQFGPHCPIHAYREKELGEETCDKETLIELATFRWLSSSIAELSEARRVRVALSQPHSSKATCTRTQMHERSRGGARLRYESGRPFRVADVHEPGRRADAVVVALDDGAELEPLWGEHLRFLRHYEAATEGEEAAEDVRGPPVVFRGQGSGKKRGRGRGKDQALDKADGMEALTQQRAQNVGARWWVRALKLSFDAQQFLSAGVIQRHSAAAIARRDRAISVLNGGRPAQLRRCSGGIRAAEGNCAERRKQLLAEAAARPGERTQMICMAHRRIGSKLGYAQQQRTRGGGPAGGVQSVSRAFAIQQDNKACHDCV